MEGGLDFRTVAMAAVFVLLVAGSVRCRRRVLLAVTALPGDVRERLGWYLGDDVAPRRHVRLVTRRLLMRGLPGWVPLPEAARRDLDWHRGLGFGAVAWVILVLPVAWGAAWLVAPLCLGTAAILAVQGWFDGPWGGPD